MVDYIGTLSTPQRLLSDVLRLNIGERQVIDITTVSSRLLATHDSSEHPTSKKTSENHVGLNKLSPAMPTPIEFTRGASKFTRRLPSKLAAFTE